MPLKPIPDPVIDLLIYNDLTLNYPNQVAISSEVSAEVTFINRGYPHWIGTARFKETLDPVIGRAMERWLMSFDGQANTFTIPLFKPTVAGNVAVSSPSMRGDGTLVHAVGAGLTNEMFVRNGVHLYRVEEVSGGSAVLNPQRPIRSGALSAATFVEGFLETPQHPDNPMTATNSPERQLFGPWLVNYRTT